MATNSKETPLEPKTVVRHLSVTLSESERAEKRKEVCEALAERAALEAEKADVMEDFKSRFKAIDARIDKSSSAANVGAEMRDVECRVEETGQWTRVVRNDTNETVDLKEKRQTSMF